MTTVLMSGKKLVCPILFSLLLTNLASANSSRSNFFFFHREKGDTLKIALASSLPYSFRTLGSLDNVLGTRPNFALICE